MDPECNPTFEDKPTVYGKHMSKSELKHWKISFTNRTEETASNLPLDTQIDDPAKICKYVHIKGVASKPVFGRDIKVNQEHPKEDSRIKKGQSPEERCVMVYKQTKFGSTVDSRPLFFRSDSNYRRSRSLSPRGRRRSKSRRRSRSYDRRYEHTPKLRGRTRSRSISPRSQPGPSRHRSSDRRSRSNRRRIEYEKTYSIYNRSRRHDDS